MPQWDFLNFLSTRAQKFPAFELRMGHEVAGLTQHGALVRHLDRTMEFRAGLVVGCDGRDSTVRDAAGLDRIEFGAPIDGLWFRISRKPNDPSQVLGNVNYGKALVLIDRAKYFQAGLIVRKGSFESIKARGLNAFRKAILQVAPYFGDRVNELRDWDQIKILR